MNCQSNHSVNSQQIWIQLRKPDDSNFISKICLDYFKKNISPEDFIKEFVIHFVDF